MCRSSRGAVPHAGRKLESLFVVRGDWNRSRISCIVRVARRPAWRVHVLPPIGRLARATDRGAARTPVALVAIGRRSRRCGLATGALENKDEDRRRAVEAAHTSILDETKTAAPVIAGLSRKKHVAPANGRARTDSLLQVGRREKSRARFLAALAAPRGQSGETAGRAGCRRGAERSPTCTSQFSKRSRCSPSSVSLMWLGLFARTRHELVTGLLSARATAAGRSRSARS